MTVKYPITHLLKFMIKLDTFLKHLDLRAIIRAIISIYFYMETTLFEYLGSADRS